MNETVVFSQHQKMLPPLELVWLQGPRRGDRVTLGMGRQRYGRAVDNDIVLDHPTVSKHHGTILYMEEGQVSFYDSESRNGISYKGRQAPIIHLKIGEEIQIGSVYLRLVTVDSRSVTSLRLAGKLPRFLIILLGLMIPILGMIHCARKESKMTEKRGDSAQLEKLPYPVLKGDRRGNIQKIQPLSEGKDMLKVSESEKQAAEALRGGRFEEACSLWRQVVSVDPYNAPAQEGLRKLEEVGRRLFEEALMIKDSSPEESFKKIKQVAAMTVPESKLYQNAQELLQSRGGENP